VALGQRYCRRYPDHAPAWFFYGRALAEARRYAEAREALGRALKLAPEDRRAMLLAQRGHMEALAGDFGSAEEWYRRTFDAAPSDGEERLYLGEILFRQGKLQEAEASLQMVTSVWNESMSEGLHLLGEVLASQERYRESLDCFERAAELKPDRRQARPSRSRAQEVGASRPPGRKLAD
jgi:tetratricopeptide (TPR) repeat protein